ncbi:LysR family transcriptional regulator [Litchfieldella anticariensis FP35 = DSM 16096]|uniref:LysR family transcriptional regulator n=1 Tax=Litchfieldella anticariensis (strain DSM 16096 / CECT 5854 / CIP 108499 / LMG 22089 / FP35) TaxID=1121939 RepID=S2L7S0_LITA3|nr:LysR family transcriptional regulator [Halomonas anticariensis]EPC00791.1 LysR family transcriptional regulator [Halomonas anticariensis FP35 = DSM 16096]
MMREELGDLVVFMAVAEERSFTRASVRLGLSQSAVSHTVRRLEESIGLKLLNRTSRRVSTTDAGEKLLDALRPSFGQINARIEEIRMLGDAPRGLVRLTASKAAARAVLWPKISQIVRDYPEVQIELNLESRLTDLAEDRFDAGVRLREFVSPDMIAVKIGPLIRMVAVAAPEYFRKHGVPKHPSDLDDHACLSLRFSSHAPAYDWEFEKEGEAIVKKVSGPLIFSESDLCIDAAKEGHGIAFVTEPEVIDDIEDGKLRRVLADWCPPFDGYHLCYSGRRQISSAFRLVIDRLRYRD